MLRESETRVLRASNKRDFVTGSTLRRKRKGRGVTRERFFGTFDTVWLGPNKTYGTFIHIMDTLETFRWVSHGDLDGERGQTWRNKSAFAPFN